MGSKASMLRERASGRRNGEDAALSSGGSSSSSSPAVLNTNRQKKPSMWKQLKTGYGDLVNAIIRPPRATYEQTDMGPIAFRVAGKQFERRDLQVLNPRRLTLECSWWEPIQAERDSPQLPCVVYMHGNSSCRLEACELLPLLLGMGVTLFAFDFAGCGLSEGEYITLGYHEKDDLRAVVDYLRSTNKVSTIGLWGRSMGASTALLHGHRDPSIAAMVLDSPYSSLERLAREIIDKAQIRHKPDFLVKAFMRMMRSTILKRSGLDILKLKPIANVQTCFIPAVFVAGRDDDFISPAHASDTCEAYAGDKNLILVDGAHNSKRPAYFLDSVTIFFYSRLCAPAGLTENRSGLQRPQPPPAGFAGLNFGLGLGGILGGGAAASPRSGHRAAEEEADSDDELQQALLASLDHTSPRGPPTHTSQRGSDSVGAAAARLVGCATSQTQSTLPDRRTAAEPIGDE